MPTLLPRLRLAVVAPALALALTTGCAVPPVGDPSNMLTKETGPHPRINWPAAYRPEDATFRVYNRIEIAATPADVWAELVAAEAWPTWYEGAKDVDVHTPSGQLEADATFAWNTMDLDFTSRITDFEPPYRLSWESRKSTIQGYHAWLVYPTSEGVMLITVESQHGFLAHMQRDFLPDKLRDLHDVWLAAIKERAERRVAERRATGGT